MRLRLPNPLTALDDRALLARFAEQRDQPAFEQLVKRHGALVFGVCRRAVRDAHLAEDAFQAVFLVLARDPGRAAVASSVGGWLFGVARRVGLAARRHELRRERREQATPARRCGGDTSAEFDEVRRVLDEELAALPDDLRAALVACFLEERTHDEAARELGWSLSTLRRRLDRGKELLRARLARRGVSLAVGLLTAGVSAPALAAVPPLAAPSPTSCALAADLLRRGVGPKVLAALAGVALAVGGAAFALTYSPNPAPDAPKPVVAPAPRPVELKAWATVSGRVVYPKDREIPAPRVVELGAMKDADVWKPLLPLHHEDLLVDANSRGIANAVVFLRPDTDDRKEQFPADRVHPDLAAARPVERTVTADAGQFRPRVLVARTGDTVMFDNRLAVPTNVHFTPAGGANAEFNVLVGKGMSHTMKPLAAVHLPDRYHSSIYSWMAGCVWTFDHPYAAVTGADGKFALPNAPAGKWRLVVWHEVAGYRGGAAGRLGTKLTIPETRTGVVELDPLSFASDNWPK